MSRPASWLNNRKKWQPVALSHGASGRAAMVTFRPERLPWMTSTRLIAAVINHNDVALEFYVTDSVVRTDFTALKPFWKMELKSICLSALSELLIWPAAEAVYTECTGMSIADVYPSRLFAAQLIKRFQKKAVPGWITVDRGCFGLSNVREVDGKNGVVHTVELSDTRLTVYRGGLFECSSLAESDRIRSLQICKLHMNTLLMFMSKPDAISVRLMARVRLFQQFELAVEHELPF